MNTEVIVELRDLHKTFKTKAGEFEALKGVNLKINRGDIFGIIGMSGAGKSTLVRCINYLEKPTDGTVLFNGQDLSNFSEKQIREARRSMGMIFQQFNLLMQRNVLDNVIFPLELAGVPKAKARDRAKELLEIVGISEKEKSYPSQLSGGQKQRVAIARALATEPQVILCDEATSALDPNTTEQILALLKDINKRLGITVIIITHEMSVIEKICSHVAIVSEGLVAESGRVSDVFTSPKSAPGQMLVFPNGKSVDSFTAKKAFRIVFDGSSSFEPIIANMVLEFKTPINIIYADSRNIEGKAYGQIVIQFPDDSNLSEKMVGYLINKGLTVEEVQDYAG